MGLLHISAEIAAGENRCLLQFSNPLLNTKQPYTLKLLKVFNRPPKDSNQDIEILVKIKDTPFFVHTEYILPEESAKISEATAEVVTKLKANRFLKELKQFQLNEPEATYKQASADDNFNDRFFNLKTSKCTYLFSNNKYILYMLGYDERDFYPVDLTSDDTDQYFRDRLQETIDLETTNCSTIYVVGHAIRNRQLSNQKKGSLKWLANDTVKSIYFQSKRNERWSGGTRRLKRNLTPSRASASKRQRRQDISSLKISQIERENTIIKDSDSREDKLKKVDQQGRWDIRAENLAIFRFLFFLRNNDFIYSF